MHLLSIDKRVRLFLYIYFSSTRSHWITSPVPRGNLDPTSQFFQNCLRLEHSGSGKTVDPDTSALPCNTLQRQKSYSIQRQNHFSIIRKNKAVAKKKRHIIHKWLSLRKGGIWSTLTCRRRKKAKRKRRQINKNSFSFNERKVVEIEPLTATHGKVDVYDVISTFKGKQVHGMKGSPNSARPKLGFPS